MGEGSEPGKSADMLSRCAPRYSGWPAKAPRRSTHPAGRGGVKIHARGKHSIRSIDRLGLADGILEVLAAAATIVCG